MTEAQNTITAKLRALSPVRLEVYDDSKLHIGHREATSGAHLRVVIVSAIFAKMPKISRHRLIQKTIGDYAAAKVHAVQISALAPDEENLVN